MMAGPAKAISKAPIELKQQFEAACGFEACLGVCIRTLGVSLFRTEGTVAKPIVLGKDLRQYLRSYYAQAGSRSLLWVLRW